MQRAGEDLLVFLSEDVPLIYLQTCRVMIYWSQRLAGRSKVELIRCETHGALRQTGKKEGGTTRRKERLQTREGQRESNWKHVRSGWAYLICRWETMTPAVEVRIRASRRSWSSCYPFLARPFSLSVALIHNWYILGTLCSWSTIFICSQVELGSDGTPTHKVWVWILKWILFRSLKYPKMKIQSFS